MASIFKRGNIWYLHYRLGGRRFRKRISSSKKIAELALADITVKLEKKEIGFDLPAPAPAKLPKGIERFLDEYEAYSKTNHRKATVRRYKAIIDNFKAFLKTRPGVINLGHLSPKLFEDYKTYKREVPVSPNGRLSKQRPDSRKKGAKANTINMEVETLRTIFGLAVKWGELSKNPVEGVKALKVDDAKAPRFLTLEEVRKLLAEAAKVSPQLHDIFFTLVHTGMRKGELQHLTWDDVDLERRVIKVQNKPDWTPKAGQREISMHKAVHELLLRLKEQNTDKSQFVFHECDGSALKLKLRLALMAVAKKCGFPDVTKLHSLRHTFGSQLVMAGVDLPTVQKEMGHSDVSTTMIYAHLTPQHRAAAVDKLNFE